MSSERKYAVIDNNTDRLPVPGGWLYRTMTYHAGSCAVHTAFVPDPPREVPENFALRMAAQADQEESENDDAVESSDKS